MESNINVMKIRKDKYSRTRGGSSRIYKIYCQSCNNFLLYYQKDGPGIIKRLYLDRIYFEEKIITVNTLKKLVCPMCKTVIGVHMIYKKENRPALRLFLGAINKTKI